MQIENSELGIVPHDKGKDVVPSPRLLKIFGAAEVYDTA